MSVTLNAYIRFDGTARQAMEFYKSVLGGELRMSTFKEGMGSQDPSDENKIMHAQLDSEGMTLMGSDVPTGMNIKPGNNIGLSLSGEDETKLKDYFEKLSAGGNVTVKLEKAPWGDTFGMFIDKFGIDWMVNIRSAENAKQN